jgi:hypothetical protein
LIENGTLISYIWTNNQSIGTFVEGFMMLKDFRCPINDRKAWVASSIFCLPRYADYQHPVGLEIQLS